MQRGETITPLSTQELAALRNYELHRNANATAGELGHAAIAAVTGGVLEPQTISFEQIQEQQERSAEQLQATQANMGAVAVLDAMYGTQAVHELTIRTPQQVNPDHAALGYANA